MSRSEFARSMRQIRSTPSGQLDGPGPLNDPHLRSLIDLLNPPDEETRLVGGAVRNALLGVTPGDIDLATTMLPDAVMRRAKAARLRVLPTGIAHGTVTILIAGQSVEVTTLREDVETDGRHARVRFGRDFRRDAERRDFTMNALSLGPDGRIHDTVGGLDDLRHGRVRFIGDPETRIKEDYLRILRFFRFHASYGLGALDPDGLGAAAAHRDGLIRLSRERIRSEMLRILGAPGVIAALRAMKHGGILDLVLGGSGDVEAVRRTTEDEAPADPLLRLAALSLREARDLDRLRDRFRLTNAETKRLGAALRAEADLGSVGQADEDTRLLRLLFAHGLEASVDAIRLANAAAADEASAERFGRNLAFLQTAPVPAMPLTGADLIERGLTGPAVGLALARFRDAWAAQGFPRDASHIDTLVHEAIDASPTQPTS